MAGAVLVSPRGANTRLCEDGRLRRSPGEKPRLEWPTVDFFLRTMPCAAMDLGLADLMTSPRRMAEALVILGEVGVQ